MVQGVNGLDVHVLEAGYESPGRPLALLLHGFPDLAYGWRHLIPILADAGYYVVAPDQRGFGRTTGWVNGYDAPLGPFSVMNMTRTRSTWFRHWAIDVRRCSSGTIPVRRLQLIARWPGLMSFPR